MVVVRVFESEGAVEMLLPPRFLRLRCQSAGNRLNLQEGGPGPEAVPESVYPVTIEPRGNYAVSIEWSDGHSGSIYPYEYLKRLNAEVGEMKAEAAEARGGGDAADAPTGGCGSKAKPPANGMPSIGTSSSPFAADEAAPARPEVHVHSSACGHKH
jgi:DUF971 family protein